MVAIAYIFAFFKNFIYGLSVYFTGKLSASTGVLDILALRFLMTFTLLFLLKTIKAVKIDVGIKTFLKKDEKSKGIYWLLPMALFEPILYMLFETLGITKTTNITAGVILSFSPMATMVVESLLLKERTTLIQKLCFVSGIAGIIYIVLNTDVTSGKDTFLGMVFMVLACMAGALYLVFSRKCSNRFTAMERTYFASFVGMIIFNFANIVHHVYMGDLGNYFAPYFNTENIFGFIYLSIISTIIATGMNNYALGKIQASTMSAFAGVTTITTIMSGIFLNGEKIQKFQIIGIALILIEIFGVSFIAARNGVRDKTQSE